MRKLGLIIINFLRYEKEKDTHLVLLYALNLYWDYWVQF